MPVVSVVIPAWNVAAFIGAAIDSVLAQTFEAWEVIVVNDGSPDSPALERVVRGYGNRPDLRYIVQENGGPSAARNVAIEAARGEYVAFLDGDDWWEPGYLAEQMAYFERDPSLDLVYCNARLVGDVLPAGRTYMDTTPSRGPVTLESLISLDSNIPTTCTMARRQAVMDAGLFDPAIRRCEDFDLWFRMSRGGARMTYHRAVLACRRIHRSSAAADKVAMLESQVQVYRKCAGLLNRTDRAAALLERQIRRAEADLALARGKRHLLAREYRQAAQSLGAARRYYSSVKLTCAWLGLHAAPGLVRRWYETRPVSG